MAVLMSVAFALPVYYLCQMGGSFFVFWLAWLISLADGIGEATLFPRLAVSPTLASCCLLWLFCHSMHWSAHEHCQ